MIARLCVTMFLTAAAATSAAAGAPSIAAGENHSVASTSDGAVLAWGSNRDGQLGDGQVLHAFAPRRIAGLADILQVTLDHDEPPFFSPAHAVTRSGEVYQWGPDTDQADASLPRRISGLPAVTAVAAHFALARDGGVWDLWTLQPVAGLTEVVVIAGAGSNYALALKRDGTVWSWGENWAGQLGDGSTVYREHPARIASLSEVVAIFAFTTYAYAVRRDGTVWAWGRDDGFNLFGDTGTRGVRTPVQVPGVTQAVSVVANGSTAMAVRVDGSVAAWGYLQDLGLPQGANYTGARIIGALRDVRTIGLGRNHGIALRRDGTLLAWGRNETGQLGIGREGDMRAGPVAIPGLADVASLAVGINIALAAARDGTVWAWGTNAGRHLAARNDRSAIPVRVAGLTNVVQVVAALQYSFAIDADGALWGWGTNFAGELGDGSRVSRSAPVRVALPAPARSASTAYGNTLVLLQDGTVAAWEADVLATPARPARVAGLTGVVAVAAGIGHGMALKSDGSVWTFGSDYYGQLGRGADTVAPAQVHGLPQIARIAAGGFSSFAVGADGSFWAWGNNDSGQLCDGTRTKRELPTRVPLADVAHVQAYRSQLAPIQDAIDSGRTLAITTAGRTFECGHIDQRIEVFPKPSALSAEAVESAVGRNHDLVRLAGGGIIARGSNSSGELGDGTFVFERLSPLAVAGGGGIGVLDVTPGDADGVPPEFRPKLGVAVSASESTVLNVSADIVFRPEDVGTRQNIYVFAFAPEDSVVKRKVVANDRVALQVRDRVSPKDSVPCVLAQLAGDGRLHLVSASNLQSLVSEVVDSQRRGVSVMNAVDAAKVQYATFFVGTGTSADSMLDSGTTRSVYSVGDGRCQPQAPQTGWWWNPAEDGRGYSIEVRGGHYFFASFLYDASGRSTWHVATGDGVSLDGSLIHGQLLSAAGGQTLGGPYRGSPNIDSAGPITLAFSSARTGTLVWPGGIVPIERFSIVPQGLDLPATVNQPESGWWWNEQESGRGFFMEWQNGTLDIAGYMYDDTGNPVWYLTVGPMSGRDFSGNWWRYEGGMTLAGPWRPHRRASDNVAPLTIRFDGPDTAFMTLPNGRATRLTRHHF